MRKVKWSEILRGIVSVAERDFCVANLDEGTLYSFSVDFVVRENTLEFTSPCIVLRGEEDLKNE